MFLPSCARSFPAWTAASVFASHDSKIVFRSAGMLGYPAGFRYKEVMGFKVRKGNRCVLIQPCRVFLPQLQLQLHHR